jgi:hypothetical protein
MSSSSRDECHPDINTDSKRKRPWHLRHANVYENLSATSRIIPGCLAIDVRSETARLPHTRSKPYVSSTTLGNMGHLGPNLTSYSRSRHIDPYDACSGHGLFPTFIPSLGCIQGGGRVARGVICYETTPYCSILWVSERRIRTLGSADRYDHTSKWSPWSDSWNES